MEYNNMTIDQIENLIASLKQLLVLKNQEEQIANSTGKIRCNICNGVYTTKNKSHHVKTQKHKTAVEHYDTVKRIAKSKTLIARTGQY